MAVFCNSPIDDNIISYLALRSLLLHDYFLSFDTYKYLTFCFDLDCIWRIHESNVACGRQIEALWTLNG
jgi:hypothetical protein